MTVTRDSGSSFSNYAKTSTKEEYKEEWLNFAKDELDGMLRSHSLRSNMLYQFIHDAQSCLQERGL